MSTDITRPFESIESAHEFIVLLEESIEEAAAEVRGHLEQAQALADTLSAANGRSMVHTENADRQTRALNLALYKLTQLSTQMHKSRRALNDLRTIRRLLFTERAAGESA
jgi:hypothetical protein